MKPTVDMRCSPFSGWLMRGLMAIALAFPALGLPAALAAPATMTLCLEQADVYPWQMKDEKGLHLILLDMVAQRMGIKIDYVVVPWKRCLLNIATGAVAGGFGASYSDDRAQFAEYPLAGGKPDPRRRIRLESYSIYRQAGSDVTWDGKKLVNMTGPVGAQMGYSIVNDLRKIGIEVDDGAISAEINMRKLVANRVKAIALQTVGGDHLSKQPEFAGKVERLNPPLFEKPYFVLIGKEYYLANSRFVDEFWNMIATVRNSPEYQKKETAMLTAARK